MTYFEMEELLWLIFVRIAMEQAVMKRKQQKLGGVVIATSTAIYAVGLAMAMEFYLLI